MTEKDYFVALSTFLPFGHVRLGLLLKYFGNAQSVWDSNVADLHKLGLKPELVSKFSIHRSHFDYKKYRQKLESFSIETITKDEPHYPSSLLSLDSAPYVLYVKGSITESDSEAVAIVGTRSMSSYGREACMTFSSRLAESGVTIVSGLALGIDGVAHKSALEFGGRTIAVLASGLDSISPVANKWIADEIVSQGRGALVSEYPLSTPPMKGYFPHRNRLIAGLSKSVLVVEGRIQSGTIHTAHHAASQGRSVFAIPGNITSPLSELPHYLLKEGARLATAPEDILEEFDTEFQADRETVSRIMPSDIEEKRIIELLEKQAMHIDEIIRELSLDTNTVLAKLAMLELKGLVKQIDEGVYGVKK